ncbi:hypothetical protein L596_013109 [Steinernema carpocapsae]|uniref:Uncharacterized protein n=1 Tax=Steinernema carpocapsae TaxID=34508 RepID=A0A4U5NZE0_STECR|nr:hypothetical protein L596_013109 [Steinernema carpocapsae]
MPPSSEQLLRQLAHLSQKLFHLLLHQQRQLGQQQFAPSQGSLPQLQQVEESVADGKRGVGESVAGAADALRLGHHGHQQRICASLLRRLRRPHKDRARSETNDYYSFRCQSPEYGHDSDNMASLACEEVFEDDSCADIIESFEQMNSPSSAATTPGPETPMKTALTSS